MSNMDEIILLPPRYLHFKRDDWNLLYDPINVIWIRVNADGIKILEALKREGTIAGVCRYFAAEYPSETAENIKLVMESYIRNLVQVGFLHTGAYREKKRELFYMDVPPDIYMMMTYQCNLKCRYCSNLKDRTHFNRISKNQQEPEMSIEAYRQLVEDARSLGVKRFLFTGGEPLLNPLTLPVGKYAKELGLKTELISNGLLIDRDNVKEMAATFDFISVSLDSMDKTTHEQMRGKGSYDKVVNSIRLLKANGGKVRANSVITRANVGQMLETWRGALEELHCDLFTPSLYCPNDNDETTNDELLPEIAELMKEQERAKAYFKTYPAVVMCETQFRFSCGIANGEIGVSYDGTIYPCHLLHKPELKCGNLREKRLGEILKESELIARLRAFKIDDIAECQPCDYKYLCGGGCLAIAYNMHGNFSQMKSSYCQYRIHDHIERMWSETVSEVKSAVSQKRNN